MGRKRKEKIFEKFVNKNKESKTTKRLKDKSKVKDNLVIGKFIANERGFGFVEVENQDEDIFIAPEYIKNSMNGDTVAVKLVNKKSTGKRAEGKIVEVLNRNVKIVVGTFVKSKNFGFVEVDDKKITGDIYIPNRGKIKAKNDDKVVVEIIKYPEQNKKAEGKIIEILGKADDTNVDLLTVLRTYDYKKKFPEEVAREATELPQVILDIDGRVDLRDREIFTIDGDDTKDIDDAISISKNGSDYILGVHIADVSNYVREGTHLDKEAVKRGTSVYLIDTVIPMLPKELSNGICSLNPGVDRYALSIDMLIDKNGNVKDSKIFKSVIRSRLQMTYNKVYKILEENVDIEEYRPYVESLKLMRELATLLINKKHESGAIDFNIPEAKITLDENDKVISIGVREITIANRIIEQFMVLANETIAETFNKKEIPFIYRVHEKPDIDRIQKLNVFLNNMNYQTKTLDVINTKYLQEILKKAKGTDEEKVISTMILRSMKLARYENENIGHFGLTSKYYCHFTSPIRRYPDLFIHRIISDYLSGKLNDKKKIKYQKLTAKYAEMSSDSERMSEEAERDLEEMKKCEYMMDHIGEVFEGIISSVTSFGMFVEFPNTIEGLVHVENMKDDYYNFDEINVKLVGEHSKKSYQIGDKVKVKLISSNKILRRIDFELV